MTKKANVAIGIGLAILLIGGGTTLYVMRSQQSEVQAMKTPQVTKDGKVVIQMTDNGFVPDAITVKAGTTVRFANTDQYWHWPASDPHPTHVFYPELDPKRPIKPGDSWDITLTKIGKWGIHDHLAPYIVGTIIVTP